MKIYKYFRGHDSNTSPTDNYGVIWLTDDEEYAQMYADESENGCVSIVYIDGDKLNYIDFDYDDDFDYLDPDMNTLEKYIREGYNCYDFTTNGNAMILALLNTDPIVKTEPLEAEQTLTEVTSKDISLSSFKIKKELHPKFWPNGKLNSRIRLRLMDIADDFIQDLSVDWVKPKDVILTGSIANYNWSRYSDVDIHIVMDFKKVYPKNTDFVDDYFKSKKENWLSNHEDLKIFGFPIEISVEDSNEDNPSSGRYSLYKNKWLVDPDDFQDAVISQNFVKKRAADFMNKIDKIEKELDTETDLHKCEKCGDKVYKIFDKLKNMRSEGLESDKKEMSSGNIIYKIMRRAGYIDKIWEIYNASYDKVNSMDDKRKEINEAQRRGQRFSAGIIPFRMNKDGKTEVFLGFPGQPNKKGFKPPMWMDRWQILKGHMESGEDPLECAIREFCEESGVSPRNINSKQLINLGTEQMTDARKLICYGLDVTDNTRFDKTKFHSNMIDRPSYIEMNGGKPYPEIVKYEWKEVGNVGASAPYETAFYQKCDEICQSRYSEPSGKKTVIISDEQKEMLKESIVNDSEIEDVKEIVNSIIQEYKDLYANEEIESENGFDYVSGNIITDTESGEFETDFKIYLLNDTQSKEDVIDSGLNLSSYCSGEYPYISINTYTYPSGGNSEVRDLMDRLYYAVGHEFHHNYQHENSEKYANGEEIVNADLYKKVNDNMNNYDGTIQDVARALYYCFKTEEDAFAAGFYHMLINNTEKYSNYTAEQILGNYKPYQELESLIYLIENLDMSNHNDYDLGIYLKKVFGLNISQIFSKLKTAEVRHKKKAQKIYDKFQKHLANPLNEALQAGFDVNTLKNLITDSSEDIEKRYDDEHSRPFLSWLSPYEYCVKFLGEPIGKGSSRTVFQIDDTRVLKLASNQMGIRQNKCEWNTFNSNKNNPLLPKIYNDSDLTDFCFLITDYALPTDDDEYYENDDVEGVFADQFNIDFSDLDSFISDLDYASTDEEMKYEVQVFRNNVMPYAKNKQILNQIINTLYTLKRKGYSIADLTNVKNWGIVNRNGFAMPVIVESGFEDSMNDAYQYYR